MRKTFLRRVVIWSVLLVGVGMALATRLVYQRAAHGPVSISVLTVLQAHDGQNNNQWPRFTQRGTLMYYPDISAGSQGIFERKLRLSVDGSSARYDRTTLDRTQSYSFDGQIVLRTTFDAGTQVDGRVINGVEAVSIRRQIATFGLLPILRRLSEPNTQAVYTGATSKGNRFQVKTIDGSWYFYANSNNLIDRLEDGEISITYGDYRAVQGLTLPFYQQVRKNNKLLYDIKLETFDLNPVFAVGFFKNDVL